MKHVLFRVRAKKMPDVAMQTLIGLLKVGGLPVETVDWNTFKEKGGLDLWLELKDVDGVASAIQPPEKIGGN